ncbi:MAG: prepilin-type N-terminal cleavage/methylation domain-containing protein [Verrucomicrobia bacterium]|nr:prepilin-type N-terminal cleavage/methylation domain-containing protein [Verrucomicrobiota bacterium]
MNVSLIQRPATPAPRRCPAAFTLIELILVMAILTMMVALSAPTLANFFAGRSVDYEARRLLALVHQGQSRAASEGVPMDLWVDPNQGTYGLTVEPTYGTSDPKAQEFTLDQSLQIQVVNSLVNATNAAAAAASAMGLPPSTASVVPVQLAHPALPVIRFLPDGTLGDTSFQKLRLTGRDGTSLWLEQTANHLSYEVRTADQ